MQVAFTQKTLIDSNTQTVLFFIVDSLFKHKQSQQFRKPVDHIGLQLHDYLDIIHHPMDLSTVQTKLNDHNYKHVEDCLLDLHLIWQNCRRYNTRYHWIVKCANELELYQRQMIKNYLPLVRYKKKRRNRRDKVEGQKGQIQEHVNHQKEDEDELLDEGQETIQTCQVSENEPVSDRSQWQSANRNIRKDFLRALQQCDDDEASLIFMMLKRRCFNCLEFDRDGNSKVNLEKIDNYTLGLAQSQINLWKTK